VATDAIIGWNLRSSWFQSAAGVTHAGGRRPACATAKKYRAWTSAAAEAIPFAEIRASQVLLAPFLDDFDTAAD
jgi:hypothetical protein